MAVMRRARSHSAELRAPAGGGQAIRARAQWAWPQSCWRPAESCLPPRRPMASSSWRFRPGSPRHAHTLISTPFKTMRLPGWAPAGPQGGRGTCGPGAGRRHLRADRAEAVGPGAPRHIGSMEPRREPAPPPRPASQDRRRAGVSGGTGHGASRPGLVGRGVFGLLCVAARWARHAAGGALARAAVVLPFTALFAVVSWLAGDPARGAHW